MKLSSISLLAFAVIISAILLVKYCSNSRDVDPDKILIENLKSDTVKLNARIALLKGANRILEIKITDTEKLASVSEKEVVRLKSRRVIIKSEKPGTAKDSLGFFVKLENNCDSIVIAQDSVAAQLKSANGDLHKDVSKLKEINVTLEAKVKDVEVFDSLHVDLLKKSIKREGQTKVKYGLYGFAVGVLVTIIIIL